MINKFIDVVNGFQIYPDHMLENLVKTKGLIFSQRVLLALTQAGMSREDAYRAVQRNAMKAWNEDSTFLKGLKADASVKKYLDDKALAALFDLEHHTKHVDTIFRRVFGEG
jgi:adenylosuccinate lyase